MIERVLAEGDNGGLGTYTLVGKLVKASVVLPLFRTGGSIAETG